MSNIFSLKSDTPANEKVWEKLFQNPASVSYNKAGVTYLAQMLAHEIVGSKRQGIQRSMIINLESLYDEHQPRNAKQNYYLKNGIFELGKARRADDNDIQGADLPLDPNTNKARIADIRNDENFIISQLHLLWMKFHNQLMRDDDLTEWGRSPADQNKIRAAVTSIFKLVIINDVLRAIIHPRVISAYSHLKHPDALLMHNHGFKEVPDIFAHAAYRFGHSMVRDSYELKPLRCNGGEQAENLNFKLTRLLRHRSGTNQTGGVDIRVPEELLFDLDSLFGYGESTVKAMRIDLAIAKGMQSIPGRERDIGSLNLAANDHNRLPTAIQIYDELIKQEKWMKHIGSQLALDDFHPKNINISKLGNLHTHDDLPLWLYVLCEAADQSNSIDDEYGNSLGSGNKLGILGSIIVLEVIIQALDRNGKEYFWFQYADDETSLVSALPTFKFKDFLNDYGVTRINTRHIIDYLKHSKKEESKT